MSPPDGTLDDQAGGLAGEVLDELIRRVGDLDDACRAVAEKTGQLYMRADEAGLDSLTVWLDQPMRNASDNRQAFAELLAELKQQARQRIAAAAPTETETEKRIVPR